ncbi:MAG TPA: hypothetical protein PLT63_03585 [Syntrophales bacterium]|nr:hypothetical protein [Syntrophales bacterium]
MNDTRRKMLTEYLGSCWHEIVDKGPYLSTCSKCGMTFGAIHTSDWDPAGFNRTFATHADLHALVCKMKEKQELWEFEQIFALKRWHDYTSNGETYLSWLITDPARTCELIAEWMEAKHGHDNKDA